MTDDLPASAPSVSRSVPATSQGLRFSTALALTVLFALVTIGGSYGVVSSSLSTSLKGALSIITLIALIGLGYSTFQLLLALIATTGERRWFARQVSERRSGERARKPKST